MYGCYSINYSIGNQNIMYAYNNCVYVHPSVYVRMGECNDENVIRFQYLSLN